VEEIEPFSGSSSSVNNLADNVGQSSISNFQEASPNNLSTEQTRDSSLNENHDDDEDQSRVGMSDDSLIAKQARGAGVSIFGGAKPVDTAAKELEIEKKLKELQMATGEPLDDTEDKGSSSR
jgi:hypothetical protein